MTNDVEQSDAGGGNIVLTGISTGAVVMGL